MIFPTEIRVGWRDETGKHVVDGNTEQVDILNNSEIWQWARHNAPNPLPSQAKLKERFWYEDGHLYRRCRRPLPGKRGYNFRKAAGTVKDDSGYLRVNISGTQYRLNRLIWRYCTGEDPGWDFVDHLNNKRDDNRIENLRRVTASENSENHRWQLNQRSGLPPGVDRRGNRFRATIFRHGKRIRLGTFDCPEDAGLAYAEARARFDREDYEEITQFPTTSSEMRRYIQMANHPLVRKRTPQRVELPRCAGTKSQGELCPELKAISLTRA